MENTVDYLRNALEKLDHEDLIGAFEKLQEAAVSRPEDEGIREALVATEHAIAQIISKPSGPPPQSYNSGEWLPGSSGITKLGKAGVPTGFFNLEIFKKAYFADNEALITSIHNSFEFYREHLNEDYDKLSQRADLLFRLWVACVIVGFSTLIGGLGAVFLGFDLGGAVTAASSSVFLFIHRVFQKREDYYRSLASKKQEYLEYGNQWLLTIQSIDAIKNEEEKLRRQSRMVEVMTQKLGVVPGSREDALAE